MTSTANNLLKVEGLTVDFDAGKPTAHRALDGVSLSIAEGEVLALVGESGSGKTVLSHSILGLLPRNGLITSGSVTFLGNELVGKSEADLRRIRGKQIAMIFQDPQASLNPVYPIGEQIQWVLKLHRGLTGDKARDEIFALFEAVKLRDPVRCYGNYPQQLSGGMSQRIMIAMALACRPKLLIADEPTSALDVSIAAEIVSLLSGLRDQFSLSILLITHDLGVATRMADRLAVLATGKLVETTSAPQFMSRAHQLPSRKLIEASRFLSGFLAAPSDGDEVRTQSPCGNGEFLTVSNTRGHK